MAMTASAGTCCTPVNRRKCLMSPRPEGCTRSVRRCIGLHEGASGKRSRSGYLRPLFSLGTDGFGRSESRVALRDFFEVDAKHIVLATLTALARENKIKPEDLKRGGPRPQHESGQTKPGQQLGKGLTDSDGIQTSGTRRKYRTG